MALALFVGSMAQAKLLEVTTEKFPSHMNDATTSAFLKYNGENPELNRAWVQVEFSSPNPTFDVPGETVAVRKSVDGLKFDAKAQQIVYEENSGKVVCANVVKGGFFTSDHVQMTGNCYLKVEKIPASEKSKVNAQDDGYFVKYIPAVKVTLEVKD